MEFNADAAAANSQLALVFLSDSVHKIYNDKDSIGYFMVKEIVPEKDKYFYPEIIYNGYDSTKQYALIEKLNKAKNLIVHVKSIDGKINNTNFSIKLSADNTIKTIFIKVLPPPIQNVSVSPFANVMNVSWDPTSCSNAKGYKIYRKLLENLQKIDEKSTFFFFLFHSFPSPISSFFPFAIHDFLPFLPVSKCFYSVL